MRMRTGANMGGVPQAEGGSIRPSPHCNWCGAAIVRPDGLKVQTVQTVTEWHAQPPVRRVCFNGELVHSCSGMSHRCQPGRSE
jgi:hypothetical protein